MSYKFKKGDRVVVVNLRVDTNHDDVNVKTGMTGTILEICKRPWVEFDQFVGGTHSYEGSKRGYTMCMWEDEIDFLDEEEMKFKTTKLEIDRQRIFSISKYPIIENTITSSLLENIKIEGVSKNMKILNIYEDKKIEKFNQELEEERNKILLKDPFNAIVEQAKKQIKDLYKNENDIDLSESDIELTSNLILMSKETQVKLENIEKNHMDSRKNLDKLLQEVNAQLELTNDYDKQIAILKNYGILDKNGKINA